MQQALDDVPNDWMFEELEAQEIVALLQEVRFNSSPSLTTTQITAKLAEAAWSKYGTQTAMRDDISMVIVYLPEKELADKQLFYPKKGTRDDGSAMTFMEMLLQDKK
jgi:hypothetical protein